jgi:hypothetical protein
LSADWTRLNHVGAYADPMVSDRLEASVCAFLQWGLAGIGAFGDVRLTPSGTQPRLRPVSDPRRTANTVWEGIRSDWLYESGVDYTRQPIQVSGVYVDGVFQPSSGVGAYAHKIDYPNGRVVFAAPLSGSPAVSAEYSYRYVRVGSSDSPWFKQVQFDSLKWDDPQFLQAGSGAWHTLAENRVQLPAVVVEVLPKVRLAPYQMGNLSRTQTQEVCFHILAERPSDRAKLHDILVEQWQKRIFGFDTKGIAASGRAPLNSDGSINPSGFQYPELVDHFRWTGITWKEVRTGEAVSRPPNLYYGVVRYGLDLEVPAD